MREIIKTLRDGPLSFRALETKVNTDDQTIRDYVEFLQQLKVVRVKTTRVGRRERRYAELTAFGRSVRL